MIKILAILSILLPSIHSYTPYPAQRTNQIKTQQKQEWDRLDNFFTQEVITFKIQTRLQFFTHPSTYPQVIKMRGRAYFLADNGKFIEMPSLSPFDVTQILVYNQKGLIIKSAQFYESFAFQFPIKQKQQYQIMFIDGPPGPRKLIQWQIDHQSHVLRTPIAPFQTDSMMIFNGRIASISQFIIQASHYLGLSIIQQKSISQTLMTNSRFYQIYIYMEAMLVVVIVIGQAWVVKRMLKTQSIV